MTDRELLELAAKAAGMTIVSRCDDGRCGVEGLGKWWNPLTDDGDALRLAVRLELFHRFDMDQPLATIHFDATDPDPYAATRCAIVRAAAEIGKDMK